MLARVMLKTEIPYRWSSLAVVALVVIQTLLCLLARYAVLLVVLGLLVLIGRVVWIYSSRLVSHCPAAVLSPSKSSSGLT